VKSNDVPVFMVKPTPGVTPDQARDARARAWSYIFANYKKHKAAESSGGEEQARREIEHVSRTHLAEYLQEQDYTDAVGK
jgi:hypothetical protein